jgi:ParB-like chromosome segregation protein Spo0J
MKIEQVEVDGIQLGKRLRQPNEAAIVALVESMKLLGQLQPISIYGPDDETALLVTGYHRLEAAKRLGWYYIKAIFVAGTEIDRELQEIAENFHRADPTSLERSNQIGRWAELTAAKVGQLDQPLGGSQPAEKGISKVARELNLDRKDVERAVKVASLSDEAKQAACDVGLDNNRSALLAVAKEATPEAQVAMVAEIKAAKETSKKRKPEVSARESALALREALSEMEALLQGINDPVEFWAAYSGPNSRKYVAGLFQEVGWRLTAVLGAYERPTRRGGIYSADDGNDDQQPSAPSSSSVISAADRAEARSKAAP